MKLKLIFALWIAAFVKLSGTEMATVPMVVEGNRPFVELNFQKSDGTFRRARFWVDTGGGGFLLVQKLAADLGLKPEGEPSEEYGVRYWAIKPPRSWVGDFELDVTGCHAAITDPIPGMPVEGLVSGLLLKNHDVIFDYPRGRFTIARPGRLKPEGMKLPASISPESGFPRVEMEIDGEKLGFLLDTGASFTMVSKTRFDGWMKKHSNWPRAEGAFGHANMLQDQDTTNWIGRLEGVRMGDRLLGSLEVVTRKPGVYEEWMSKEMTSPIVGALGGNILMQFRVEIHYASSAVYLKHGSKTEIKEFNAVPWTVGLQKGAWAVMAAPETSGARPGDEIVSINDRAVQDFSLAEIQDALLGQPGDKKMVTLRRGEQQISVKVVVAHGI